MSDLLSPLGRGGTIGHWQLSPILEERFDVPDEPMTGDMDARFFLSRHRNFIPHEYPCRRIFAERHRDRRPEPAAEFHQAEGAAGWWFPFGADRVDLSGFWHRPTRVEAWARTAILAAEAGTVRLRLATCGAAILMVDGQEAAWMAPYMRNLETAVEVEVELSAGRHELAVWMGDLCERDTRWWFSLAALAGPALTVALPVPVESDRAAHLEALLAGMGFTRPAYPDGTVTVRLPAPTARTLRATVRVEGHFMSADRTRFELTLPAGADRLPIAPVAALPADFRYYRICLADGPMAVERPLGVEAVDAAAQGEAPTTLSARAEEALAHVARGSEPDPCGAIARLALDLSGPETDAMIQAALPAIADVHDCADFLLVPLLWARIAWPDAIDPAVRAETDRAILGFRYWLDEPGNDVMWFYSENHALLFHTAAYLAGGLFPDARFARSGRTGAEQQAVGRERLLRWLDHFDACEMAEWNSAPYFPIDLKGLCALFALAPDADLRRRAEGAIQRLFRLIALACHQGLLAASQGRSYEHTLRAARTLELSAIARLLWGRGWFGRQVQALPLVALAIRDHGLTSPPELAAIAHWQGPGIMTARMVQGEGGFAPLTHAKTRAWAMGSLAAYRHFAWGYQETVLHLRVGDHPDAQVWLNHPGERIVGGYARPSYWGGCGTIPRVHQHLGLAVVVYDTHPDTPDFTHAYVPVDIFDEVVVEERRLILRGGEGLALIQADGPIERVASGPTAGFDWVLAGRKGRWLVRLSDMATEGSLAAFARRMASLAPSIDEAGILAVDDPDYGRVLAHPSGVVEAGGRRDDPTSWTHAGLESVQ
jgi:hypothetical protein